MTDILKDLDVYLVGGAVRDQLLGYAVKDRDWVITGTTPQQMIDLGFLPVGKDFPVFLHPDTKEEYALARTERKIGKGYHGFEVISDPTVTLEQDLLRRDLTINAIAMDNEGQLIDPWNGQQDLTNRVLRHVSDAFAEDPVRVLRIARFAARFADKNFQVDAGTAALMHSMVANGEIDALVAERVWQELNNALQHEGFHRFIEVLRDCGALRVILPEVDNLFGVPQTPKYHPEIDTGLHTMLALKVICASGGSPMEKLAVLFHDLGKALTPKQELPSHRGHEARGIDPINKVCDRLRVPNEFRQLALKVCEFHLHMHRLNELKPATVLKLLEGLDAFRNRKSMDSFIACCIADTRGRHGSEQKHYPQAAQLERYYDAAAAVDSAGISAKVRAERGADGAKIGEEIRRARVNAIRTAAGSIS